MEKVERSKKKDRQHRAKKVTEFHIQEISKFCIEHSSKRITVGKIQNHLKTKCSDLETISDWSIVSILKKKLNLSYKKCNKMDRSNLIISNKAKYFESAATQILLEDAGYELIFVDEFSFTERKSNLYSWGPRSQHWRLSLSKGQFSCSWMVGFSRNYFYGVMITKDTWTSEMFIKFIHSWIKAREEYFDFQDRRMIFIWDNTSIHRSEAVREYIKKTEIKILTICPYSPSLNPVEKMILAFRSKIGTQIELGK